MEVGRQGHGAVGEQGQELFQRGLQELFGDVGQQHWQPLLGNAVRAGCAAVLHQQDVVQLLMTQCLHAVV